MTPDDSVRNNCETLLTKLVSDLLTRGVAPGIPNAFVGYGVLGVKGRKRMYCFRCS